MLGLVDDVSLRSYNYFDGIKYDRWLSTCGTQKTNDGRNLKYSVFHNGKSKIHIHLEEENKIWYKTLSARQYLGLFVID
jgi:hypothetical protein